MTTTDQCLIEDDALALLPMRRIVQTWWPLAASWLLMAAEAPALSAVVARLAEPEINLAAFGVVYSLALIIESPILMLLSASTALSKDWDSYLKLRRFMMCAGAILTVLYILIAFTPLYYVVAVELIGAPAEIVEPARVGLMIMIPWTWSIAYRRFNQGVLIRFGHARAVSLGTLVRLSADGLVLATGYLIGTIPGIVVATSALSAGVASEAIYAGLRVRPVLRDQLKRATPVERPLTFRAFLDFYVPLAMTSLLNLLVQPIGSATISRMPDALNSLAVWPVVSGFVFLLRSLGFAYSEVVIALLDEPRSAHNLRRFAALLAVLTTVLLLVVAATPLAPFWFGRVSGLNPRLVTLASRGLWVALPLPGLAVLQHWYQGALVHSRRTRGITEAVAIFLIANSALLWVGAAWGRMTGLYVGLAALGAGGAMRSGWLWHRSRPAMQALQARDAAGARLQEPASSAYLLIAVLARTTILTSSRIIYPFLLIIARGLGISLTAASGLVTLRLIAGMGAPFLGPLADRYGRRRMMEVALSLFTLASLLLAGIGTFTAAAIAFVLYGMAKVLYDPAVHAYLGDAVPYRERGRAIGTVELSWSSAWLLGVPASGFLIERFGWRAPWAAMVVLGLISLGLTRAALPPIRRRTVHNGGKPFVVSIVTTGRNLLRRRPVVVLLLTGVFLTLANEIPFIVYGAWLEATFGLSLTTLGLASAVVGLAEAAAELGTTVVTDRLGKRHSVLVGLLGLTISLAALPWLSRFGLASALAGVALMMLTFEFGVVSLLPLATELAPDARATLLSLNVTALSLSRILGAFVGGWLWRWQSIALHAAVGAGCALIAALLLVSGIKGFR